MLNGFVKLFMNSRCWSLTETEHRQVALALHKNIITLLSSLLTIVFTRQALPSYAQLKHLYSPSAKKVEIVDVPKMNFLMVDGEGDPNIAKSFSNAIEALYPLSYTLKFMVKKGKPDVDYGALPLEALWWANDMSAFSTGNKDA